MNTFPVHEDVPILKFLHITDIYNLKCVSKNTKKFVEHRGGDSERKKAETYKREEKKLGRNDPCHCGSGKKYKRCCG